MSFIFESGLFGLSRLNEIGNIASGLNFRRPYWRSLAKMGGDKAGQE